MSRPIADPKTLHPVILPDGTPHLGTVFLAPAVRKNTNFVVGDFTYASAHIPPEDWAFHLAPYLYDFSPEKLEIGRFCQIADGVTFITSSANHRHDGFSSFPFMIFTQAGKDAPSMPQAGPDTIIGHDVWIGQGATIMPGARIGNGVIVAAGSVVTGVVPDYCVIGGNPARTLRHRFDEQTAQDLVGIAWWDWPIEHIARHEAEIIGADIDALRQAAPVC